MPTRVTSSLQGRLILGLVALGGCGRSSALVPDAEAVGTTTEVGGASGQGGGGSNGQGGGAVGGAAALASDAAFAAEASAPGSGGMSTDSGSDGPVVEPLDGGADSFPGVPLPPYTGGIVDVVNSSNWNETIHPFTQRKMLVRDGGNEHLVLLDLSRPNPVVWKVATSSPWDRGEQLIGNNQVMGSTASGYEVFDLSTGLSVKAVSSYPSTQSAYRMANGETMLTRSGTKLDFLDKSDRIAHEIDYPGYGYVRLARPTRNGTFLVPSDTQVFEGDGQGNVLWKLTAPTGSGWGHVFEPMLMSDGDTILSTFYGASLDIIDKTTHMVTKRYGTKMIPNAAVISPSAFAEFQILPNGNLVTTNWQNQTSGNGFVGRQIIEFNPNGDVVWVYQQDPMVFSDINGVLVLDGLDPQFPHALEISPDSTWQPIIPSP
jgi:hypothetical protein